MWIGKQGGSEGNESSDRHMDRRLLRPRRRRMHAASSLQRAGWLAAGIFLIHCMNVSLSLSAYQSVTRIRQGQQLTMKLPNSRATLSQQSPLFQRRPSSSTARHMVLTTPESIIEQASTQNLLDDLIDESVRTSARRPIMMQFDPSSGWVR